MSKAKSKASESVEAKQNRAVLVSLPADMYAEIEKYAKAREWKLAHAVRSLAKAGLEQAK